MKSSIKILFLLSIIFMSCNLKDIPSFDSKLGARDSVVFSKIAKWHNDHKAAIVITNDSGLSDTAEYQVMKFAFDQNVTMNYEIVTDDFIGQTEKIQKIFNRLFYLNHGIYGHGHWHYNHDQLSYSQAYDSFSKCFNTLDSLDIPTYTYAYPGGNGYYLSTRKALKEAGFLAGRLYDQLGHLDPYILPENELKPKDWYSLPTLVMQAYDYDACDICINNTQELIPFLEKNLELSALLIITYHAIGQYGAYGFYHFDDFKSDILAIAKRDLWTAKFDDAVLYAIERENAKSEVVWHYNENEIVNSISIKLSDDYTDNKKYFQPLTVLFELPMDWVNKKIIVSNEKLIVEEIFVSSKEIKISLPPDEKVYNMSIGK